MLLSVSEARTGPTMQESDYMRDSRPRTLVGILQVLDQVDR
jgi:hypothetical protein